jgi:hypothetical protein
MLGLFSQAVQHEVGPGEVSTELMETRLGDGATVFSKYISIGDDLWTTLGTIHYAVEEGLERGGEGDENEGVWTEPEIPLQEVRSPSNESTRVSPGKLEE